MDSKESPRRLRTRSGTRVTTNDYRKSVINTVTVHRTDEQRIDNNDANENTNDNEGEHDEDLMLDMDTGTGLDADDNNDEEDAKTFTEIEVHRRSTETVALIKNTSSGDMVLTQVESTMRMTTTTVSKPSLPLLSPCPSAMAAGVWSSSESENSKMYVEEENEQGMGGRCSAEPKVIKKGDQVITSYVDEETGRIAVYEVGVRLEVGDFSDDRMWYPAKIVEVDTSENEILVHFENWSSRFDEWIKMDSNRLRPSPNTNVVKTQFEIGEKVEALWSIDGQRYPGIIQSVLPNDYYQVLFDDGIKLKKKYNQIFKVKRVGRGRPVGSFTSFKSKTIRPPPALVPAPGLQISSIIPKTEIENVVEQLPLPLPASPTRRSSRTLSKSVNLNSPPDLVKGPSPVISVDQFESTTSELKPISVDIVSVPPPANVVPDEAVLLTTPDESKPSRSSKPLLTTPDESKPSRSPKPLLTTPDESKRNRSPKPPVVHYSMFTPITTDLGKRKRTIHDYSMLLKSRHPKLQFEDTTDSLTPSETTPTQSIKRKRKRSIPSTITAEIVNESEVIQENDSFLNMDNVLSLVDNEKQPNKESNNEVDKNNKELFPIISASESELDDGIQETSSLSQVQKDLTGGISDDTDKNILTTKISTEITQVIQPLSVDPDAPLPKRKRTVHNYSTLLNPKFDEVVVSSFKGRPKRNSKAKIESDEIVPDESMIKQSKVKIPVAVLTSEVEQLENPVTKVENLGVDELGMENLDDRDNVGQDLLQETETVENKFEFDKKVEKVEKIEAEEHDKTDTQLEETPELDESSNHEDPDSEDSDEDFVEPPPTKKGKKIDDVSKSKLEEREKLVFVTERIYPEVETTKSIIMGKKSLELKSKFKERFPKDKPENPKSPEKEKIETPKRRTSERNKSQDEIDWKNLDKRKLEQDNQYEVSDSISERKRSDTSHRSKRNNRYHEMDEEKHRRSWDDEKKQQRREDKARLLRREEDKRMFKTGGERRHRLDNSQRIEKHAADVSRKSERHNSDEKDKYDHRTKVHNKIEGQTSKSNSDKSKNRETKIKDSEHKSCSGSEDEMENVSFTKRKSRMSSLSRLKVSPGKGHDPRLKKEKQVKVPIEKVSDIPSPDIITTRRKSRTSKDLSYSWEKTLSPITSKRKSIHSSTHNEKSKIGESHYSNTPIKSDKHNSPPKLEPAIKIPEKSDSDEDLLDPDEYRPSPKPLVTSVPPPQPQPAPSVQIKTKPAPLRAIPKPKYHSLLSPSTLRLSSSSLPQSTTHRKRKSTASRKWRARKAAALKAKLYNGVLPVREKHVRIRMPGDILNGMSAGRLAKIRRKLSLNGVQKRITGEPVFKDVCVDIIHCSCGLTDEHGLMIQCELCQCWQHGNCFGIEDVDNMPPYYVCESCQHPDLQRDSKRTDWSHEFNKTGVVPRFSFSESVDPVIEKVIQGGNELLERLYSVSELIHSTHVKINICDALPDHPKIYQWHKPHPTPNEEIKVRSFNKIYRPVLKRLLRNHSNDLTNYKAKLREKVEKHIKLQDEMKLSIENKNTHGWSDEIVEEPNVEIASREVGVDTVIEEDHAVVLSVMSDILSKLDTTSFDIPASTEILEPIPSTSSNQNELCSSTSSVTSLGVSLLEKVNSEVKGENDIDMDVDVDVSDADIKFTSMEEGLDAAFNLNPDRLLESIEDLSKERDDPETSDLLLNIFDDPDFGEPICSSSTTEMKNTTGFQYTRNLGPEPQVRITPELCRINLVNSIKSQQELIDEHLKEMEDRVLELENIHSKGKRRLPSDPTRLTKLNRTVKLLLNNIQVMRRMTNCDEIEPAESNN